MNLEVFASIVAKYQTKLYDMYYDDTRKDEITFVFDKATFSFKDLRFKPVLPRTELDAKNHILIFMEPAVAEEVTCTVNFNSNTDYIFALQSDELQVRIGTSYITADPKSTSLGEIAKFFYRSMTIIKNYKEGIALLLEKRFGYEQTINNLDAMLNEEW